MRSAPSSRFGVAPIAVALLTLALAVGGGLVSRQVIEGQEAKLLAQASTNAASVLSTTFLAADSSLRALNGIDGPPSPNELREFAQRPGPLGGPTIAVATVVQGAGGFVVGRGAVGSPSGTSVDAAREALAQRALRSGKLVTAVLKDAAVSRLVLAVAGPGPGRWVTLQESGIAPTLPIPQVRGSAFSELRGVAFTSKTMDDGSLLLRTDGAIPSGRDSLRRELVVGANTFVLVVASRQPLVGGFAALFPLVVFVSALLVGAFATTATLVLTRRRAYAMRLVDARTADLNDSLVELAAARSALERMVTGGPTLVVKRDLSPSRVTYVSPNAERILGHTVEAAMAEGFVDSYGHADDRRLFAEAVARVAAHAATSQTIEMRLRDGAGNYRWISLQIWQDEVVDGRVVSIVEYALDVDDRHKAEEAQKDAQHAAEVASDAKTKFLSHVSHELRTPLNAILGFGQLLQADVMPPDQRESVDLVVGAGRHLLTLVNELLDISSIESGYVNLATESLAPLPIVRACAELLGREAGRMNVTLSISSDGLADAEQCVFGDALRVKPIVLNLLSNAIKYNRKGGAVAITTQPRPNDRVAISFADTGRGIAASRLSRLFVPFERLGAENSDIDGIGLGLALARQLARAMHGDITVASSAGEGSTFTLDLPSAAPHKPSPPARTAQRRPYAADRTPAASVGVAGSSGRKP
ncbi:MAG: hypothetical protein QOK28_959 [Actinomycetota bacterium]